MSAELPRRVPPPAPDALDEADLTPPGPRALAPRLVATIPLFKSDIATESLRFDISTPERDSHGIRSP